MKRLMILVLSLMLFASVSSVSFAGSWDVGSGVEETPGGHHQFCVYKKWTVQRPEDPYQPVSVHTGKECTFIRPGSGYPGYPYGHRGPTKAQKFLRAGQVGLEAADFIIDILR